MSTAAATLPRLSPAQRRVHRYIADNPGAYGLSRDERTRAALERMGLIEPADSMGGRYRQTALGREVDPPDVAAG